MNAAPPQRGFASKRFEVQGSVRGEHGGARLIVRRKGPWFDWSIGTGGDLTTDLRIHTAVLGRAAAAYFGFVQLGPDTILLPTADEINGALDRLDRGLPRTSPVRTRIRFHEKAEAFGDGALYVTRFCEEGLLPVSRNPKQFFHDIIGHSLQGLYCENELQGLIARRYRLWQAFTQFLRRRRLSRDERIMASELGVIVELRIGLQIDSSSNFLFNLLPLHAKRALGRENVRLSRSRRSTLSTRGIPDRLMPSLEHESSPETFYRALFRDYLKVRGLRRCELTDTFWSFYAERASAQPELARPLSYPLLESFRAMERAMRIPERAAREAQLGEIPFAAPFIRRVARARAIAAAQR